MWAIAYLVAFAPVAVMVDKPVTVTVAIPDQVRHAGSVLLKLEGVVVRRDAPAVWNVFWDMPQATAQTSVNDIHFAGYVTSLANSALRDPKPANFTLQLPAAAITAIHRQSSMRLTFVPTRKLPEGGVTITALRLE
jgi:hypothetical protein